MPTNRPRITVTLTEHQHDVLQRLARHTGQSMSSIVGGLVETTEPVLERTVVILTAADKHREVAAEVQATVRPRLRRAVEAAQAEAEKAIAELIEQGDLFAVTVPKQRNRVAGGEEGRNPPRQERTSVRGGSGGRTPVAVTRGSGRRKSGHR